jgi:hypothetical protein
MYVSGRATERLVSLRGSGNGATKEQIPHIKGANIFAGARTIAVPERQYFPAAD